MKWEYVRGHTSEAQSPGAAWNPQEPDSPGRRSLRRDDPVFYICFVFPSVPRWYVRITQNSPHQQVVELNQDRIVPELTGQTPLVWPQHWAPLSQLGGDDFSEACRGLISSYSACKYWMTRNGPTLTDGDGQVDGRVKLFGPRDVKLLSSLCPNTSFSLLTCPL